MQFTILPTIREDENRFVVLVVKGKLVGRAVVEERDIPVPLVDPALADYFLYEGVLIETPWGAVPAVKMAIIWRGTRRDFRGALWPVTSGADLVLPLNFFDV